MPNHRVHGSWRSFKIGDLPGDIGPLRSDGEFYIRLTNPDGGYIETGSNHDGKPLVGRVTTDESGDTLIDIEQHEAGFIMHYKARLLPEQQVGGQTILQIGGRFARENRPPTPNVTGTGQEQGGETGEADRRTAQEQGTWVGSKP